MFQITMQHNSRGLRIGGWSSKASRRDMGPHDVGRGRGGRSKLLQWHGGSAQKWRRDMGKEGPLIVSDAVDAASPTLPQLGGGGRGPGD